MCVYEGRYCAVCWECSSLVDVTRDIVFHLALNQAYLHAQSPFPDVVFVIVIVFLAGIPLSCD